MPPTPSKPSAVAGHLDIVQRQDVEAVLAQTRQAVKSFVADPERFRNETGHPLRDEAGQNELVDMAVRATAGVLSGLHATGHLKMPKSNIPALQEVANDAAVFAATLGTGYDEAFVNKAMLARIRAHTGISLGAPSGALGR